jgi:hypothetical protein
LFNYYSRFKSFFKTSVTIIKYSTFLNIKSNSGKLYFSSNSDLDKDLNFNELQCVAQGENLDPNWITGFSDAESCFSIIISKRSNLSWRVSASFEINLHVKDINILYQIQNFFRVGSVTSRDDKNICVYRVTKIEDLINIIIPHFIKYPLLTQKYSDFILFTKVVELINNKEHLKSTGFMTILNYYASINRGLSSKVLSSYPDIVGVDRIKPNLPNCLNPNWVSGFTAGDGGFSIGIRKKTNQIYFRFHITQHSRDISLMELFIKFFGFGKVNVRSNQSRCDYYVQDFSNIYKTIIPHFDNYPLYNSKSLDFLDFKKAANLYKADKKINTEIIKEIISNMNSKRKTNK